MNLIIKEAKKKIFDGWSDWRHEFLRCGICLCDDKSAVKLEKALDSLFENNKDDDFFLKYEMQDDIVTRYLLHRHLNGKNGAKEELYSNIDIQEGM